MSTKITFAELYQQEEITKAESEKVARLIEHLSNPKSAPLSNELINQLTLSSWIDTINAYRNQLKATIGNGIDDNLKQEIQDKLIAEEKNKVQSAYEVAINRLQVQLESYRNDLINQIKALKYPSYNGKQKEYFGTITTVKNAPDMTAKLIGTVEFQQASNIPLKYINVPLLKNYFDAGRIDLCSALLEKFALNKLEFDLKDAMALQEFGTWYYEKIGVSVLRETLRYVKAIIQVIKLNKGEGSTVAQLFGTGVTMDMAMKLKQIQLDYEKESGWDSLLES